MQSFELSFSGVMLRFFLMMGVIILAGFTGQWWLAFLGLPIFLSTLLGISTGAKKTQEAKVYAFKSQDKAIKKVG